MISAGNSGGLAAAPAIVARVARPATRLSISHHAIARYRERVAQGSDEEIVALMSGRAFAVAATMGRCAVIMANGARAIVEDGTVVTVLPIGQRVMNWARHAKPGAGE